MLFRMPELAQPLHGVIDLLRRKAEGNCPDTLQIEQSRIFAADVKYEEVNLGIEMDSVESNLKTQIRVILESDACW